MNSAGAVPGAMRYRFGVFEFDGQTLELTKNGRSVAIRPQPVKLLALLLTNPGELVSRNDLQRTLWNGDTFVDFEQGVNHAIRELRAALGDDAESPRFIQTLPRRGYRFIAPVVPVSSLSLIQPVPAAVAPEGHAVSTELAPPNRAKPPARGLRILVAGASLILAAGIIALAYVGVRLGTDQNASPRPTILAVRAISVPADPALGIGLANAISARLAQQQVATVWSEHTVNRTHDTPAGEDDWPVGATHVLEGDAAITGTQVDVVVRLRSRSNRTLWSERIQVDSDELFDIEAVIAERVVGALRLQLAAAEQARLRQRYTSNGAAYADYLRGRAALTAYTREGTLTAVQAFEDALQRDPAYTLARAGLAMASADMYLRFAAAEEAERWGERAEAEARAALELDPDLAEAHLARAAVARKREFDWDATLTESRRALTLNPNLDQARFFAAGAY